MNTYLTGWQFILVAWGLLGFLLFILTADGFFTKIHNGWKAILWVFVCGPVIQIVGLFLLVLAGIAWLQESIANWFHA